MSRVAVSGNKRIWDSADASGETRAYESELHPRQPTYDISVN
jgi:hypothetical protein